MDYAGSEPPMTSEGEFNYSDEELLSGFVSASQPMNLDHENSTAAMDIQQEPIDATHVVTFDSEDEDDGPQWPMQGQEVTLDDQSSPSPSLPPPPPSRKRASSTAIPHGDPTATHPSSKRARAGSKSSPPHSHTPSAASLDEDSRTRLVGMSAAAKSAKRTKEAAAAGKLRPDDNPGRLATFMESIHLSDRGGKLIVERGEWKVVHSVCGKPTLLDGPFLTTAFAKHVRRCMPKFINKKDTTRFTTIDFGVPVTPKVAAGLSTPKATEKMSTLKVTAKPLKAKSSMSKLSVNSSTLKVAAQSSTSKVATKIPTVKVTVKKSDATQAPISLFSTPAAVTDIIDTPAVSTSSLPSVRSCSGITAEINPKVEIYLSRPNSGGGGAIGRRKVTENIYGKNREYGSLTKAEKKEVDNWRSLHFRWICDGLQRVVRSSQCDKVPFSNDTSLCNPCSKLLHDRDLRRALNEPLPDAKNLKYTNKGYFDKAMAELYAGALGVQDLLTTVRSTTQGIYTTVNGSHILGCVGEQGFNVHALCSGRFERYLQGLQGLPGHIRSVVHSRGQEETRCRHAELIVPAHLRPAISGRRQPQSTSLRLSLASPPAPFSPKLTVCCALQPKFSMTD